MAINYSDSAICGELLKDDLNIIAGQGTWRENSKIFSKYTGFVKEKNNIISVTPLNGVYMPKKDDFVIGQILRVGFNNWSVDINSPFVAMLYLSELKEFIKNGDDIENYYRKGDVLYLNISAVTKSKFVNVSMKPTMCKKLYDGLIISVCPTRVKRIIGKSGSMIKLIIQKTGCNILVGQNGLVYLNNGNIDLAIKTIRFIEKKFLEKNLTKRVEEELNSNS
ncbi:MAG: RNA-binding protein [Candidatus Aenigmarchaeota archaeon ex4484_52]|nr:MAG: RNA-binding protein [Candidatus Aenigmarchaeota archaeon ex4484_52]